VCYTSDIEAGMKMVEGKDSHMVSQVFIEVHRCKHKGEDVAESRIRRDLLQAGEALHRILDSSSC